MTKQVLVIDDDEAIRKSFILALEDTGYSIDTTESGGKGIKLFERNKYNLIFLDLKMPGLNGVETLRELRKLDDNVLIYIITAFYGDYFPELQKAIEDKIDFEVLRKPLNNEQIILFTKSMLNKSAKYQDKD